MPMHKVSPTDGSLAKVGNGSSVDDLVEVKAPLPKGAFGELLLLGE